LSNKTESIETDKHEDIGIFINLSDALMRIGQKSNIMIQHTDHLRQKIYI